MLIGSSNWCGNTSDEGSGDAYAIQTRVDEGSKRFSWTQWVIPQPVPVSEANLHDEQEELRYLGGGQLRKNGSSLVQTGQYRRPNGVCNVLCVTPVGWGGMLTLMDSKRKTPSDQVRPFEVGQGTQE